MSSNNSTTSLGVAVAAGALVGAGLQYCFGSGGGGGASKSGHVTYEVNLEVQKSVKKEYHEWLEPHCKELLQLPGFIDATIAEDEQPDLPTVLFVLGGPGAGKGTQCSKIVEKFGYQHISAGDCLRAERKNPNSKNGALINQYIKEGKIVPVEITVKLLKKAMDASEKTKFLIDGFPRDTENVRGWFEHVGDAANVAGVLFFDCPEEVMEKRLLERGQTSGRADDNIESIKKRFKTYQASTMPVINLFRAKGIVQRFVANKPIDAIFAEVSQFIETVEKKYCPMFRYIVSYRVESREHLQEYFDVHSKRLRGDGIKRFNGKFTASRRILKVVTAL
jgi:UMP-CMP kinase